MYAEIQSTKENAATGTVNHYRRVFGEAQAAPYGADDLKKLAKSMTEGSNRPSESAIPSGYTYLGQFINHEVSRVKRTEKPQKVEQLENLRIPFLDLTTLYGNGPTADPHLYESDQISLKLGMTSAYKQFPFDLPRKSATSAEPDVVDPRNDENLALAQFHVLLIKFHNAVVKKLRLSGENRFEIARKTVTLHFQSVVVHDYLRRIIAPDTYEALIDGIAGPVSIGQDDPYLPAEFSFAAFRFGHAMIRRCYVLNLKDNPPSEFELFRLFDFVGSRKFSRCGYDKKFSLPTRWIIDWRLFFEYPRHPSIRQNMALKIEPIVSPDLARLKRGNDCSNTSDEFSIAELDFMAGTLNGLLSGQEIARLINAKPVPDDVISRWIQGGGPTLLENTPLWFYVLAEASYFQQGERLGPVGSAIVGGTLYELVKSAPLSILTAENFKSVSGKANFSMTELLEFIEDTEGLEALNPLAGNGSI